MAKYDPLEAYLRQQAAAGQRVVRINDAGFTGILTAGQPRQVALPTSAWNRKTSFWGNTTNRQRRQAAAWLRAGWRVRHPVNYTNRIVTFER